MISSEAGAAGEAGEIEKDSRHEEDVTASGGIFFPLVVESLGLWTLSDLCIEGDHPQWHSPWSCYEKPPPAIVNSPVDLQCKYASYQASSRRA